MYMYHSVVLLRNNNHYLSKPSIFFLLFWIKNMKITESGKGLLTSCIKFDCEYNLNNMIITLNLDFSLTVNLWIS